MKLIKNFIFLLITIISFHNSVYSQNFGPDKIAFGDTTYDVDGRFVSVAFNGWIYIAFNYHVVNSGWSGRLIEVSKDNGLSWQTIADIQSTPQNSTDFTSMVVGGTDTTNLRVFTTITSSVNPYSSGSFVSFDANTGNTIPGSFTFADGFFYSNSGNALCTDSRHPNVNSNPYSVMLVCSRDNPNQVEEDSVFCYYSNDGGLTFSGPHPVASSPHYQISSVDVAYGSTGNPANTGEYSLCWFQHGSIAYSKSDANNPFNFSAPIILDSLYPALSGALRYPKICSQSSDYSNSNGDFSTIIVANKFDSVSFVYDLIGFYNNATQSGNFSAPFMIDTSADNTTSQSLSFDEINGNFLFTYFNRTTLELPFFYQDLSLPGNWTMLTSNYADTSMFYDGSPVMSANPAMNDIVTFWVQETDTAVHFDSRGVLKMDVTSLPLLSTSLQTNQNFLISTNSVDGTFNIFIDKELLKNVNQLEIYSVDSRLIFSEKINPSNVDFIKSYKLDLLAGVYFISLSNGKSTLTEKIIIQ